MPKELKPKFRNGFVDRKPSSILIKEGVQSMEKYIESK